MPIVEFADAREMVKDFQEWLEAVSKYIDKPGDPLPSDFYASQKLSFEIDKGDLEVLINKERVVGILCLEPEATSLSVILVGVNADGKPTAAVKSRQTWPKLNGMEELPDVLATYLTP